MHTPKYYLLILLPVLTISCVASISGGVANGRYTNPDGEVSVAIPPVPDVTIADGGNPSFSFVDFTMGRGYWMAPGGAYSLEWYKDWFQHLEAPSSAEEYFKKTEELLPAYVARNFTGRFHLVSQKQHSVRGRPAYRFVARGERDGLAAIWVGTSIWFEDRVAVALMSLRIEDDRMNQPEEQLVPWERYDRFCASIQRLN